MKVVPYTTKSGLQIGCRYESPKRIECYSRDAFMLQTALLTRFGQSWPIARMLWRWL